jgi:hypothetical protein
LLVVKFFDETSTSFKIVAIVTDSTISIADHTGAVIWLLTTFLSALFGSAFGGYFGKKGEIQALHEDLSRVIAQNEAITRANETIKDRLTNQTWDRQRQWEMKRDAVITTVPALGRARDALMYLAGSVSAISEDLPYEWQRHPELYKLSVELIRRLEEFDEKRLIASFLCSDELSTALTDAGKAIRSALSTVQKEKYFSMSVLYPPVRESVSSALQVARKEIGI